MSASPSKPVRSITVPDFVKAKSEGRKLSVLTAYYALWAKLRTRPELAGHLRLNVPAGTATKLQAGGYSQAAAQAACARLRSAGITCAAVPG